MPTSEQLDGFDDNERDDNEEPQDQQFDALSRALARSVFESVLGRLRKDVVGHDDVLQHLALVAAQHTAVKSGGRVLLVGPSGCGKTTLARALAASMSLPSVLIEAPEFSETNWEGTNLADVMGQLYSDSVDMLGAGANRGMAAMDLMQRSVVIIDEIDKITSAGWGSPSSREYRRGKQQSLLPLLGTGTLNFRISKQGPTVPFKAEGMLIICCGVFDGLPDRNIASRDLVALGLMPELVDRMGSIHRLRPLATSQLTTIISAGMTAVSDTVSAFGYTLEVLPETLIYAAQLVQQGIGGTRAATSWLRVAAESRCLAMLDQHTPEGSSCIITPDDLVGARVARRGRRPPPDPPPDDDDTTEPWGSRHR